MKKLLLPFLIALLVVSCTDSVPQDLTTKQIFNYSVSANDWTEYTDNNGLNRYYSCHFNINELNSTIYNNGAVVAYIGIKDKQQILPYVIHNENSYGHLWTRTVDFDYSNGGITFYVTNSDFAIDAPGAMNFRVVLMW